MDVRFWLDRWHKGEIGFHQEQVNSYLEQYWDALGLECTSRIFVPLCGKSNDMAWLMNRGHAVLGVELSETAVESFFSAHNLEPARARKGPYVSYHSGAIEILCGDFFSLTPEIAGPLDGVYDRAALVAFPPDMRRNYSVQLDSLLTPETKILLITLEYPAAEMDGPPFPVPLGDVEDLFGNRYDIRFLHRQDALDDNPRFKERGLSSLNECAYRMKRR